MTTRSRHHAAGVSILCIALINLAPTRPVEAQDPAGRSPPLAGDCTPAAQAHFTTGLTLLHHMTYPAAREAFELAKRSDDRCAIARWGVAMTLFQPLWPTRPSAADMERGRNEVRGAIALGTGAPAERSLIAAGAAFYEEADIDYWARIRRWHEAMAAAHRRSPAHDEIGVFYALSQLATAPADTGASDRSARAAALLLTVLERDPEHPGAQHYLVHANDAPGREWNSPDVVRRYAADAPANPHALHMPTHIYVRQGDWPQVVAGNLRAAEAALAHPAGDRGQFVWDEFPHAVEYLVYALLQQGEDSAARAHVVRLQRTDSLQPTFKTAFHLSSTAARHALERRDWRAAMALPVRQPPTLEWSRFPWAEAVTWFARGFGAARLGEPGAADEAVEQLAALEQRAADAGEALFARNIRILRLEVTAWDLQTAGQRDSAVATMQAAVTLEAATPKHAVTPAPTLPAAELLGELLLEQGRPEEALAAFRRSLSLYPRRLNGLLGAARAAELAGEMSAAREYYDELERVAPGGFASRYFSIHRSRNESTSAVRR